MIDQQRQAFIRMKQQSERKEAYKKKVMASRPKLVAVRKIDMQDAAGKQFHINSDNSITLVKQVKTEKLPEVQTIPDAVSSHVVSV